MAQFRPNNLSKSHSDPEETAGYQSGLKILLLRKSSHTLGFIHEVLANQAMFTNVLVTLDTTLYFRVIQEFLKTCT